MAKTVLKDKVLETLQAYADKNPYVKSILRHLRDAPEAAFREFLLDLLNDEELENYGTLVFEELLALVHAEERQEAETKDQAYT